MRRTRRTLLLAGSCALSLCLIAGLAVGGQADRPAARDRASGRDAPRRRPAGRGRTGRPGRRSSRSGSRCAAGTRPAWSVPSPRSRIRRRPATARSSRPAAFGDRFGLSAADEDQLVATLTSAGLTVIGRVPQRTSLRVRGTVADLERVLGLHPPAARRSAHRCDLRGGARRTRRSRRRWPARSAASSGLDPRLPVSAIDVADAPPPPSRGLAPRDLAVGLRVRLPLGRRHHRRWPGRRHPPVRPRYG